MSRFVLTLLTIATLAASAVATEPKPGSAFDKKVSVPANTGFAVNISGDGQAATIIFDNVLIDLDAVRTGARSALNQTVIETKIVTVNLPYSTDMRSLPMTMDVRGTVNADSAATARLVVCAGDATSVVDLTAEKIKLKGKVKCALEEALTDVEFVDFEDRIEFTVQRHAKKPVLQVTLILVVEHDADTADVGSALLAVDSLDLEIGKGSQGKLKR